MTVATLKNIKPITPADKLLKLTLDRASTQTVETDPDICPECGSMTSERVELRDGNYMEICRYCYGCGALQT